MVATPNAEEDVEEMKSSYTVSGNGTSILEDNLAAFYNTKYAITIWPTNCTLGH